MSTVKISGPHWETAQRRTTTGIVQTRWVTLDGQHAGVLRGIRPSPSNATRATAWHWTRASDGYTMIYTRLAEARSAIARQLTEGVLA